MVKSGNCNIITGICEANQLKIVAVSVFFYSHDTNTKVFWHFKFIFSKIQNKENKYMYTNTSKIEYILYKIYTAVVKSSPICSFCPWWCSEGLTAEPAETKKKRNWKFVLFYFFFFKSVIYNIVLHELNTAANVQLHHSKWRVVARTKTVGTS